MDEAMIVILPAPMADAIREAVAAGDFASTSDVMRAAVRAWHVAREDRRFDLDALRRAWDDGRASGSAGPLDMTAIMHEARVDR